MESWSEHCEGLTHDSRAWLADRIAFALQEGGPGPGADFLKGLRDGWGVADNYDLLTPLLNGEDPKAYVQRHWDRQLGEAMLAGVR